jgi:DNA-binding transcriptional ArsR family regulator
MDRDRPAADDVAVGFRRKLGSRLQRTVAWPAEITLDGRCFPVLQSKVLDVAEGLSALHNPLTAGTATTIVQSMVNDSSQRLDRLFSALGDPTRRAIVARLARDDALSVSQLAAPFEIKLPAVMKHLDILEEVGLIRRAKQGRIVTVELSPRPLKTAMDWIERCERVWESRLDRIARFAEKKERESQERHG